MTRKCVFDVCIADGFETVYYPLPFPRATGNTTFEIIEVEYEPGGGDEVEDAAQVLGKVIKEKYPGKVYKYFYWNFLDGS
jgi:hypothetical protein